jgi:hypothetical protein
MDKRHVYEWDTKIHLVARGPGIRPGSIVAKPGTQVDIAPTLLGLAGIDVPEDMDGRSIVPFLVEPQSAALPQGTRRHLDSLGDLDAYHKAWRQEVFIEYYFVNTNIKCVNTTCEMGKYPERDANCADLTPGANADCWCGDDSYPTDPSGNCYATEDTANNFIAVRSLKSGTNTVYVEYQSGDLRSNAIDFNKVDFVEYFDLDQDHVQLNNLARTAARDVLDLLSKRVHAWLKCSGKSCP